MPAPAPPKPSASAPSALARRARLAARLAVPLACAVATVALVKAALSPELVREHAAAALAQAGSWAPVIFLGLLVVRPVLLLPGQAFAALAGVLWGGLQGGALTLLGSALAMLLVVALGRTLLRRVVERRAGARRAALGQVARRHDFHYALLCALNPLLPSDLCIALGAAAGGRRLRLVLGAVVGSIPGTFATASFGGAAVRGEPAAMALGLAAILASLLGGAWLGRSVLKGLGPRRKKPSRPPVLEPERAE